MLNRLFRFFTRPSDQASEEQQVSDDEPQDMAVNAAALADFVRLVSRHLGEEKSEELVEEVLVSEEEPLYALKEAGYGDDGLRLVIGVDWKAYDEIDWQVDLLLVTRGIAERWEWQMPDDESKWTVMTALKALQHWLQQRGLTLLHIDSGGDDYHCLIIEPGLVAQAVSLGADACIDVSSHQEFLIRQRDEDAEV